MISKSLRNRIEDLLNQPIPETHAVSGGSINRAAKITAVGGQVYFLKWNDLAAKDMFPKEQRGLELLQSAESGLRIPAVYGTGTTGEETDFIIIEFIHEGSPRADSAATFGKQLAALHQTTAERFGLDHDNYIGRLPQSNQKHQNWVDFFVEERLQPQVEMAVEAGKFSADITPKFARLYKKLPDILVEEPASLLHGDLWGGNYLFDENGAPAVYDPAVYYGNREIEIAFTYLFGGFSREFYDAYQEKFPLQPDFSERKDIYNLYPLLVHTNMFGGSYPRQVKSIIKKFLM